MSDTRKPLLKKDEPPKEAFVFEEKLKIKIKEFNALAQKTDSDLKQNPFFFWTWISSLKKTNQNLTKLKTALKFLLTYSDLKEEIFRVIQSPLAKCCCRVMKCEPQFDGSISEMSSYHELKKECDELIFSFSGKNLFVSVDKLLEVKSENRQSLS